MMPFIVEAQLEVEELKVLLKVDSLDEIKKKKLDKFYIVIILCANHPEFDHVRGQILTG